MHGAGGVAVRLAQRFPQLAPMLEILPQMPCPIGRDAKPLLIRPAYFVQSLQNAPIR